jgi:hypothetical protein
VSLAAAGAVVVAPGWLLLGLPWQVGIAVTLLSHAVWRGGQGVRSLAYRRNLRRLRRFEMASAQIPWSASRLYLGRGFRWDQRHTQRLFEARQPASQRLLAPAWWEALLPGAASAGDSPAGLGGDPALHGVEPEESDIWMDLSERVGHTLVLGTTRVGKTRLAEVLIAQDQRFMPKIESKLNPDGSMNSAPLHEMFPPLDDFVASKVLRYLQVKGDSNE